MVGVIYGVSVEEGDMGCRVLWLCNFFTTFGKQVRYLFEKFFLRVLSVFTTLNKKTPDAYRNFGKNVPNYTT
jgi:hypothetical protein